MDSPSILRPTTSTWVSAALLAAVVGGLIYFAPNALVGTLGAGAVFVIGALAIAKMTQARHDPAAEITEKRWQEARGQHADVLGEYGNWELDPELLLTAPGLWDYSRPEVQGFFDAMARAEQLATADYPGAQAEDYVAAVDKLRRSWHEASRYAMATGCRFLDADSRSRAETALKLWRHAQSSTSPSERETYARRALADINELVRRRILPAQLRALRAIESAAHGQLEA